MIDIHFRFFEYFFQTSGNNGTCFLRENLCCSSKMFDFDGLELLVLFLEAPFHGGLDFA